jgi:hypothetical protein
VDPATINAEWIVDGKLVGKIVNGSYIAVDEWSSDDLLADEKLVCE